MEPDCAYGEYVDELGDCTSCEPICEPKVPDVIQNFQDHCRELCPDVYRDLYETTTELVTSASPRNPERTASDDASTDHTHFVVTLCVLFALAITVIIVLVLQIKQRKGGPCRQARTARPPSAGPSPPVTQLDMALLESLLGSVATSQGPAAMHGELPPIGSVESMLPKALNREPAGHIRHDDDEDRNSHNLRYGLHNNSTGYYGCDDKSMLSVHSSYSLGGSKRSLHSTTKAHTTCNSNRTTSTGSSDNSNPSARNSTCSSEVGTQTESLDQDSYRGSRSLPAPNSSPPLVVTPATQHRSRPHRYPLKSSQFHSGQESSPIGLRTQQVVPSQPRGCPLVTSPRQTSGDLSTDTSRFETMSGSRHDALKFPVEESV